MRRRYAGFCLKAGDNELIIRQNKDVSVVCGDNQDVISEVVANTHRYHCKSIDGVLYATKLDDNNSLKYDGGADADVSNVSMGDTLVYIPRFYITMTAQIGDITKYKISRQMLNDDSFMMGDVFIGAYGGDFTNGQLNSIVKTSGSTSTWTNLSQVNQYAKAKGAGYSAVTLEEHNLYGFLYVALMRNTDCKGTLGTGANSQDRMPGASASKGMLNSKPGDVYNNFLGIENWYGGRYELVGNMIANKGKIDGIYHVTERDGTIRQIQSIPPESKWMYPRKMILGKRFDIVADPSCYQGEITSGHGWFSEQYMRNETDRIVMRGGFQADISSGFAFLAARFKDSEISQFNTITSRIVYKGAYQFVDYETYLQK